MYNPDYLYWVSEKVKGIDTTKIVDPAKRFENITNWYVQYSKSMEIKILITKLTPDVRHLNDMREVLYDKDFAKNCS